MAGSYVTQGHPLFAELARCLGLQKVRSLRLNFDYKSLPTAEVTFLVTNAQLTEIVEVFHRFNLVALEPDEMTKMIDLDRQIFAHKRDQGGG